MRQRRCHGHDGVEIEMTRRDLGKDRQACIEIGVLAGLHEPEMPLGQHHLSSSRGIAL